MLANGDLNISSSPAIQPLRYLLRTLRRDQCGGEVVLVGITPGITQTQNALVAAAVRWKPEQLRAFARGEGSALAFSGPPRANPSTCSTASNSMRRARRAVRFHY
jgi:hypothetical protein